MIQLGSCHADRHQFILTPLIPMKTNPPFLRLVSVILSLAASGSMALAQNPPATATNNATNAAVISKPLIVVEKDARAPSDGKGWRLDQAVITDPARPRVLLVGDSILNGYLSNVLRSLQGKAYVDAWVNPYCQSERFNQALGEVLDKGPYDVVHINVGLHGFQKDRVVPGKTEKLPRIPTDQFEPLTKAFVEVIRTKNPKDKIIWASTTPITAKDKPTELDPESNPIIIEHNRMAAKVMGEMHVPVNDFYGMLVGKLDLKRNELHWTGPAYTIIGNACADSVIKALPASGHQQ